VLTTAGRMDAGFRGILISNDGIAQPDAWWLSGESRTLYPSEASLVKTF
jgi:hypothetical protein